LNVDFGWLCSIQSLQHPNSTHSFPALGNQCQVVWTLPNCSINNNKYIYMYIIHYILYNIIYVHIPQVIAQLQCANNRVSSVAPWTSARHSQGQGRPHQAWQRDLLSIEIRCFQSWLMIIDYCWWLLLMIVDWWWLLMIIADDYWWLVPIDYLVGGFNPSEKY
jgi:hypothetical protein